MATTDVHAWAVMTLLWLGACADEAPPADESIGGTAETSTSASEPDPEPEPEPDCVSLEMTPVDHLALDGDGCSDATSDNAVLTTQDEVDAHTDAYCQSCCASCSPQVCANPPKLAAGSMIVYAYSPTPSLPADMEILSVEDCGDSILVKATVVHGCSLAFSNAWDSVAVPALDKPLELDIELLSDPSCEEPP